MKPFVRSSNKKRKFNAAVTAVACSMLLFLPGCMIPKLQKPEPGPAVPQNFNLPVSFNGATDAENSSQLAPAEFFTDPNLITLFNQALDRNQQLRILAQNINIANNEVLRRRGFYLPFLSFGTGASLNKYSDYTLDGADNHQDLLPNGMNFPYPLPDFMMAADVSWQIDIWRQLRYGRNAAALRYLGTRDGWNYVVTRLVAEIAENYYRLLALDNRIRQLDFIISLQENSLKVAQSRKEFARDTELGVQRFRAEVRKNQSQKLIINQDIIQVENRINFLCGRYPQPVQRATLESFDAYIDLTLHSLAIGVPSQLIQNRPDVRQAERDLEATGLDVRIARANFFPKLVITADIGYEAFNPRYLFITPESLIGSVAGGLVAPLINKKAIQADYMNANASQLQALYNYQRTILNSFIEVINFVSKVQNYSNSIAIKKQQLAALESAVSIASLLFQQARAGVDYMDVLFAQRDMVDARMVLIETKQEQLSAIVTAYQSLGGGQVRLPDQPLQAIGARPATQMLPPHDERPPVASLPPTGAMAPIAAPPAAETPPAQMPLNQSPSYPRAGAPPAGAPVLPAVPSVLPALPPAEPVPAPVNPVPPGPVIQGPPVPVLQGPAPPAGGAGE